MSIKSEAKKSKIGMPPGTLTYVGKDRTSKVTITEISFTPDHFEEKVLTRIDESEVLVRNKKLTTWINGDGVHNVDNIERGGRFFDLDQLVMEDILNTNSRPKFEDYDDYLFLSMRMLTLNDDESEILNEQLSLVLGKGWIISLHESEADIFNSYRDRIRHAKGTTRHRKEDFIFYRLIDITVDNYYHITAYLADEIDDLEVRVLNDEEDNISEDIFELKRKISAVKKALIPLREAISTIIRTDTHLIEEETYKYFRDVLDHITQEMENNETQREIVNDFLNLYMTTISNKMNDVMKLLTIYATIFIPLTFIAGIYGMNFDVMPELNWKYGYWFTWFVMIVVAASLLIYFRRKKWI